MWFQNGSNKVVIELRVVEFWSAIRLVISNRTRAARSFDFEITRMISDQIALHSVQLPWLISPEKPISPRYRLAMSTISFFQWNLTWNSRVKLWISLNRIAFFLKKIRFIYVCVTVVIFNVYSRKAIPGESTVKNVRSQRMGIQVESGKKSCLFLAP